MNITEQDCIDGREAVRRDGEIMKLTKWKSGSPWPVMTGDGSRRADGHFFHEDETRKTCSAGAKTSCMKMPGFTVEDAQKALDGNYGGLLDGFEWAASPQRLVYWDRVV